LVANGVTKGDFVMSEHETYRFLKLFRNENEEAILALKSDVRLVGSKMSGIPIHFFKKMESLKEPIHKWVGHLKKSQYFFYTHNNKLGKGIFFIPNPGGTKSEDILSIRAFFIDYDMAKVKIEYIDKEAADLKRSELIATEKFEKVNIEVSEKKKRDGSKTLKYIVRGLHNIQEIKRLKDLFRENHKQELVDTLIVETYAGYHIYWLTKDTPKDNFKSVQRALANKFDSDPQIINPSRLMRLPGFKHQKYDLKVLIKVIQWSEKRWTEEELINTFELKLSDEQIKGYKKKKVQESISYFSPLTRSVNTIISNLETSDLVFKDNSFQQSIKMTFNEALQWLLAQPLDTFIQNPDMRLGQRILCPFHGDKHPSATVFISKNNEYVFHCHSCDIGTKNIIGLYRAHMGSRYKQTVQSIARLAGIEIVETNFEQQQFEKYRSNSLFLEQNLELLYPNTAFYLNNLYRKSLLRFFNDKGETNILKEEFQYKSQNVFFISFRAIAKETGKKNMRNVINSVNMLNLCGFIERVPEESIPTELLIRAQLEKKALQEELQTQGIEGLKRSKAIRLINFYIVPNWSDTAIEIEGIAAKMRLMKFTFSKTMNKIGIDQMFGPNVANKVYPDARILPVRFEKIANKLKAAVETTIRLQGFCIIEDLIKMRFRIVDTTGELRDVSLKEKINVMNRCLPVIKKMGHDVLRVRSPKRKVEYGFYRNSPMTINVIISAVKK
jgi:hypothetical protein